MGGTEGNSGSAHTWIRSDLRPIDEVAREVDRRPNKEFQGKGVAVASGAHTVSVFTVTGLRRPSDIPRKSDRDHPKVDGRRKGGWRCYRRSNHHTDRRIPCRPGKASGRRAI